MTPLIECDRLVKIYRIDATEVVALQGLELAVEEAEVIGVVGTSGSGKSTLLSAIGGLLQPSAGRVLFDGHDLAQMTTRDLDRFRRDEVGFVWQETNRNLIPHLTAQQNVMTPMGFGRHRGDTSRAARALELLDLVGVADRAGHRPNELSGGQQQRVAIAVALSRRPRLLLADEPTGELDAATAVNIHAVFRAAATELGVAHVIVSHDPALARHVDRVVAVRDGQLASEHRGVGSTPGAPHEPRTVALVDRHGRLQIPDEHRDELGITDRVVIEPVDGGLRLSPPARPSDDA